MRIPSLSHVSVVGLLMVGAFWVGQHRAPEPALDATVPAALMETIAQARCGLWVFEDGSVDFEADDAVRSECYRKLTGTPLFQHPLHR